MIAIVEIIARRLQKKEESIKNSKKKETDSNDLARSFLEESWRRNIECAIAVGNERINGTFHVDDRAIKRAYRNIIGKFA